MDMEQPNVIFILSLILRYLHEDMIKLVLINIGSGSGMGWVGNGAEPAIRGASVMVSACTNPLWSND